MESYLAENQLSQLVTASRCGKVVLFADLVAQVIQFNGSQLQRGLRPTICISWRALVVGDMPRRSL